MTPMRAPPLALLLSLPCIAGAVTDADAQTTQALERAAQRMQANLPQGDGMFAVVAVTAGPGRRLNYSAVSAIPAAQWTPELKAGSRRVVVNDYCSEPAMTAFRQEQVVVAWQYTDRDGRYIMTDMVGPTDCQSVAGGSQN